MGYNPEDVVGRSCFDYFHPDEVPFARKIHSRGIQLDKAAVLHYARVRGSDGEWVGCECVFTITYQVMVACTSIYRGDAKNYSKYCCYGLSIVLNSFQGRAAEAPTVRRMFASSPRDPRYHMLEHLSSKFRTPPQPQLLEPRAALILNRFSHSLTVMYSTNAVAEILGVSPEELDGKSFYDCMQENCYPDAEQCLRSAKENDSIAYLRFWYRDPRQEEEIDDAQMRDASASSDSDEDGGVRLNDGMDVGVDRNDHVHIKEEDNLSGQGSRDFSEQESTDHTSSRTSSSKSSRMAHDSSRDMFDGAGQSRSSRHALAMQQEQPRRRQVSEPREIEAVVSCTSDGLVVVLRRARQQIPFSNQPAVPANGFYAAPWGAPAIRPHVYQPNQHQPFQHGFQAPAIPAGGPPADELLASIQDVAVFAWSLVGINGNIASYGHGTPRGEAQPPTLPIWNPFAVLEPSYIGPENQAALKWAAREISEEPQNGMDMVHQQQRLNSRYKRASYEDQPEMYQQHMEADNGHGVDYHSRPSMHHQQRAMDYSYEQPGDNNVMIQQSAHRQNNNQQYHFFSHSNQSKTIPSLSRSESQESPRESSVMSQSQSQSNTTQLSTPPPPSESSDANRYLWY